MEKRSRAVRCGRLALAVVATLVLLPASPHGQLALGNAISYQGRLTDGGAPATGSYDLRFTLFDAVSGGAQVGSVVTAAATTVTAGVFTVSLDFGAGAFAGSARWLEVAVRQGVNPFTILAPRQALLAGPHALYAVSAGTAASATTASTATTAVTAASATTATSATTAITAATAITANQLEGQDGTFYLNFVNHIGTLAVGQGGTGASSVATSPFLTKNLGTCAVGSSLHGINSDGTVVCEVTATLLTTFWAPDSLTTADHTSMTVGTDGLGLISYYDVTNGDLKVAHCGNALCSSAAATTLDSAGIVGLHTSITIGADGLGLVSYQDSTNGHLKVAHCANVACSSAALATLDSSPGVGSFTSITIGADNLGLISYFDAPNEDLKVAHCANALCSSAAVATLDSLLAVGSNSSITIGADGRGLVSYWESSSGALKVAHCANASCSSAAISTLDSGGVGSRTSITIGTDGLGLISYSDNTNASLKVAHCANAACSSATLSTVDGIDAIGVNSTNTSITVGTDGLALISYAVSPASILKVAHCANAACSSATLTTVDDTRVAGFHTSIALGPDGLPLISYADGTDSQLRVLHCGDAACSAPIFVVRRR